jgi:putative ABC transport system permease protein
MLTADDEAVIGKKLVGQLGAKVGDEVILLGQTQDGSMSPAKVKLVGIVDLGNAMQNRQIFLTFPKVQYMADLDGGAIEILAYAADRSQADKLADALAALPALQGKDVKAWDRRAPFDGMLAILDTVQGIAAGVIVFITALGVLNTMLMSVMERTAEIGVMRAMGLRRVQVVQLFVLEAVGISVVGGVLGGLLGGSFAQYLHVRGVNLGAVVDRIPAALPLHAVVYPRLTPEILGGAVLLGLLMAFVGGLVPALRASTIQPIDAMRQHR